MRRLRIRFTILSMQLAILAIALILGIRFYINPAPLGWRDLEILLFVITSQALVLWLLVAAPWTSRFFALGFGIGVVLENLALSYSLRHSLIHWTPGPWTPEGWYPLTLPVERLFILWGWMSPLSTLLSVYFTAMALSGVLCGGLILALWSGWRWLAVRPHNAERDTGGQAL